jgi:hypothetical protein
METYKVRTEYYYCSKTIKIQSRVVEPNRACRILIRNLDDHVLVNKKVGAFLIKSEFIQDFRFKPVIIYVVVLLKQKLTVDDLEGLFTKDLRTRGRIAFNTVRFNDNNFS